MFGLSQQTLDDLGNVALSLFLALALMTLRLWELAGLAVPLAMILIVQVALVALVAALAVPRVMGRDYESIVMAGGFVGFMLGTSANAMANMSALVERFGPAPKAFLTVPLVGAFFIDFINAVIITFCLNLWSSASCRHCTRGPVCMAQADSQIPRRRGPTLTQQIFIGLALGIIAGWLVSEYNPAAAVYFRPFSQLFLRLIKMIIAPLIFATLVAGIAGAGHVKVVGRMGLRAIIYFEIVTTLALVIGLVAVNVMKPGVGVNLPMGQQSEITAKPQTWDQILLHVAPESVIKAMADGDVLQIVVFSILFAVALGMIGEKGRPVVVWCEAVAETMFKFTNIVMHYAPIGVGAAIAYTVGHGGLRVLVNLAWLVATLYLALTAFVLLVLLPVALLFKVPIRKFVKAVKEPAIIAFSTTSSEAALPRAMEVIERLGVPRKIVAFVLPLGYSFNLDGTTLYLSLAAVFVAQAAGVELTVGQQITMLLTLMLTSKGVAGVPRASLVILAGTLASYGLPLEGVTLILGVDELMDMARTMVNVVGNCLATVVIAKWEGEFTEASDQDLQLAAQRGEI